MSTPEFEQPITEELGAKPTTGKKSAETTTAVKIPTSTSDKSVEASFMATPDVVGIGQMINGVGNDATDIIKERINNHLEYLTGQRRFNNEAHRLTEQTTFIETIGNVLKLDFPQYVVVTDYLLQAVLMNKKIFTDNQACRFCVGLSGRYPADIIGNYQKYIAFLTRVAVNWTARYKLRQLLDISSVIVDFDRKGKENVTRYFAYLTNV